MKQKLDQNQNQQKIIKIDSATYARLLKIGNINSTYDDIIRSLLEYWEQGHNNK
jgi:hypothetical protein